MSTNALDRVKSGWGEWLPIPHPESQAKGSMPQQNGSSLLSRRHFLARGRCTRSVDTSVRPAMLIHPGASHSAAPRGKQRNRCWATHAAHRSLNRHLSRRTKYRPFPTIHDRGAWERLCVLETSATLLAGGEKYLSYKWPEMPATVFLEYARNGNRTDYENIRNARMRALAGSLYLPSVSKTKADSWTTSPTECGPRARRAFGAYQPTSTFSRSILGFQIQETRLSICLPRKRRRSWRPPCTCSVRHLMRFLPSYGNESISRPSVASWNRYWQRTSCGWACPVASHATIFPGSKFRRARFNR